MGHGSMGEAGFRQSSCDHSLFVCYTAYGMVIFWSKFITLKKQALLNGNFLSFFTPSETVQNLGTMRDSE